MNAPEAALVWLDMQGTTGAAIARLAIQALVRENNMLHQQVSNLDRGIPLGVTADEWEIIQELREACR